MSYQYAALRAEYEADLARMVVTRGHEVDETARRLLKYLDRYEQVTAKDGVPAVYIASSFEREASSDFRDNPAQGDPLNRVSRNVPRGMGPYTGPNAWVNAAVDAYRIDGLDKVGASNWVWPRFCFEGELFNGFGPRMRGKKTGYLWAGTNVYTGGKFVRDGVWSSTYVDTQLGIVPIAKRMVELNPSLDLGTAIAVVQSAPADPVIPATVETVSALQGDLNILGAHLNVDGSLGANTRRAVKAFQRVHGLDDDGIPGPDTWRAITAALKTADQTAVVAKITEQPEHNVPTLREAAHAFFARIEADLNRGA
jgi:lysozyme family protein